MRSTTTWLLISGMPLRSASSTDSSRRSSYWPTTQASAGHAPSGQRRTSTFFPVSGTPSVIIYRSRDVLEVLRVWHGRRDPTQIDPESEGD